MNFKMFIVLIFLLFARPQDFFSFLGPLRLPLLFLFATLFLTVSNKDELSLPEFFKIKECKLYFLFFSLLVLGIPFAYHSGNAFDFIIFEYLADAIFFYLLVANVQSIDRFKKVLLAVSVSVFFQAAMSLMHGSYQYGRFFPGTMFDPNDLAFFLVALLPLFFVTMRKSDTLVLRFFSISGFLLSTLLIFLTGSRGGLLGLGVVLCFLLLSKVIIKKTSVKIVFLLAAGLILFLNAGQINMERLQSITDLSSDYNVTGESGRLEVWKRGFRLVKSNPLTGVGVTCFGNAIGQQRAADGVIPRWQTAHNSFVQVAAETGIIGFWLFVSLFAACLMNFRRLSKLIGNKEEESLNLPGICILGLVGAMVCGFFLSQGYSLIFTFYFALSAILRNLSEKNHAGI